MIDYHLHTPRCCHAAGLPQEYLAEAEKKELVEIGFADHFPLDMLQYKPKSQVTMQSEELDYYIEDVRKLQENSSRVSVKMGIEVDYLPGTEKLLSTIIGQYGFDYIIGSIHFMEDWDFTHPVYAESYRERDIAQLYEKYFKLVENLCSSGLFDIIGHVDVIKKFGYRPSGNLNHLWQKVARLLKNEDMCLELNTAGKDAPVGSFYPDRELLEICYLEKVPVTLGSDAHAPDQVGRYFHEAIDILKSVGYSELAVFEKRVRKFKAI